MVEVEKEQSDGQDSEPRSQVTAEIPASPEDVLVESHEACELEAEAVLGDKGRKRTLRKKKKHVIQVGGDAAGKEAHLGSDASPQGSGLSEATENFQAVVPVENSKREENEKENEKKESNTSEVLPKASDGEPDANGRLLKLFQERKCPSTAALENLLQQRADPNHRFQDPFVLNGPRFLDGCPLQFAVSSGDCDLVKLLMEYSGDIHTSSYSKLAGARQDLWRGNAPFAALLSDNVNMLKLLVESHNVSPNLTSSLGRGPNPVGASLLWNSSYFGALKCTLYLLEARADINKAAPFQDIEGLNYAPLHVAARAGNDECCELLLDFGADVNSRSYVSEDVLAKGTLTGRWYFTPLDAAIETSQIAVVKLLLKRKADLIGSKETREYHLTAKSEDVRVHRYNYSLQSLLRSGNSRVISEVAEALQDSSDQVTLLTVKDIARFLKTPGEAPVNLMKALFYRSGQIKYWQKLGQGDTYSKGKNDKYFRTESIMAVDPLSRRVYAQSANIQKILVYGQAQYVINFTEGPSKEAIDEHWRSNGNAKMEEDIPLFVSRLAPQPTKEAYVWKKLLQKIFEVERVYLPVNFFACLVPDLHRSEEVLLAIARCPNQEIFRLRECEAIVSFNWTTVQYVQLFDLLVQAMTSLCALLCISTLRDEAPEWCDSLSIFAGMGLPFVTLTLFMRVGEAMNVHRAHRAWDMHFEVLLHSATLALFVVFLSTGQVNCVDRGVVDDLWMRSFIIIVTSLRLMYCCEMLRLAFSAVNMIVTPIITALTKSLPFCIAVIYFAFIMWQAYWTLDVEEWQNGFKAAIIAWRFAILGDFEVDELEGQEGTWHYQADDANGTMLTYEDPELTKNATVVRGLFIVVCGMMFPVLIMNILISVLSVWLDYAIKNVWLDFQQARARRVLRYKAMMQVCRRRAKERAVDQSLTLQAQPWESGTTPSYIWFSAPKDEEVLHQEIDPALNLKFKEVCQSTQKLDSRLKMVEKNVQILVENTIRNEKRRAKQAFTKAFTSKEENAGWTA